MYPLTYCFTSQARASLDRLQAEAESISGTIGDTAANAVGVGAVTAEKLSEAIGRGGEKLVLSAEGAGRVVKDGILAVSKSATEGLPAVQNRIFVLSSQVGFEQLFSLQRFNIGFNQWWVMLDHRPFVL